MNNEQRKAAKEAFYDWYNNDLISSAAPERAWMAACEYMSSQQSQETAWLIENGNQGDSLRYRSMTQGLPTWTPDHNQALRFARRVDAEMFAAEDEDAWRIAEHMWSTPPTIDKP